MTTTHIFRKNKICREKIKFLYNTYHNRYNITYDDYYITINGVSYGCEMLTTVEKALKVQDVRLDLKIRIDKNERQIKN